MKKIVILVPESAVLGSIEGPRQVFTETNKFLEATGRNAFCEIILAGLSKEVPIAGGKYQVNTDKTIDELNKADLIIIPALDGDLAESIERNKAFIPWIFKQYKSGAEVASLCLGAFLLAATGLVQGKSVATHWMAANAFRMQFPDVQLVEDRIITDAHGIYTSGGAFSYL